MVVSATYKHGDGQIMHIIEETYFNLIDGEMFLLVLMP